MMAAQPPAGPPPAAVLIFLKGLASPIVLYAEDPLALYEEIKQVVAQAKAGQSKLIEKPGHGPLKKVSFLDTELTGCALQVDPGPPQGAQRGPAGAPGGGGAGGGKPPLPGQPLKPPLMPPNKL